MERSIAITYAQETEGLSIFVKQNLTLSFNRNSTRDQAMSQLKPLVKSPSRVMIELKLAQ